MNGLIQIIGLLATIEFPGPDEILNPMYDADGSQHQDRCQANETDTLMKTESIGQK